MECSIIRLYVEEISPRPQEMPSKFFILLTRLAQEVGIQDHTLLMHTKR